MIRDIPHFMDADIEELSRLNFIFHIIKIFVNLSKISWVLDADFKVLKFNTMPLRM